MKYIEQQLDLRRQLGKAVAVVVIAAMLASTLFTYAPYLKMISSGFRIIIVTVAVAAVAAIVAPVKEEAHE